MPTATESRVTQVYECEVDGFRVASPHCPENLFEEVIGVATTLRDGFLSRLLRGPSAGARRVTFPFLATTLRDGFLSRPKGNE
jgi:hypothetical protein